MPKLKASSGARKRFKRTKSGRIKCKHAYHRHYLTHKSPKRKRRLRPTTEVSRADRNEVIRLLPYG